MTQVSQLSPDLARGVLRLARALSGAERNCALYPPEHPAVGHAIDRLAHAVRQSVAGAAFSLGVTPETLLVEGVPADRHQQAIAEAAALLHDRDILHLTFVGDVPVEALRSLLKVLTLEAGVRRDRGGPAQIWLREGHPSILVGQIDYGKLLERDQREKPEAAKRDDLWHSIVQSVGALHHATFDQAAQQRLLAIGGSANDIRDLAPRQWRPSARSTDRPCSPARRPPSWRHSATCRASRR